MNQKRFIKDTVLPGKFNADEGRIYLIGIVSSFLDLVPKYLTDRIIINCNELETLTVNGLVELSDFIQNYHGVVLFEDCSESILKAMYLCNKLMPKQGLSALTSIKVPWIDAGKAGFKRLSLQQCLMIIDGVDLALDGFPADPSWLPKMLNFTASSSTEQKSQNSGSEKSKLALHDIRQCLRNIEGTLADTSSKNKALISRQIRRAEQLLDSAVGMNGSGSSNGMLYPFTLDLLGLEQQDLFAAKGKSLQINSAAAVKATVTDSEVVEQVVLNLLSNACDACKTQATLSWRVAENGDLVIEVTDDGDGLPPHIRDLIFTDGATYGKSKGSGFGLYGAYNIAKNIGADLHLTANSGSTKFIFRIPGAVPNKILEKRVLFAIRGDELFLHYQGIISDLTDRYSVQVIKSEKFGQDFSFDLLVSNDPSCLRTAMLQSRPFLYADGASSSARLAATIASQITAI